VILIDTSAWVEFLRGTGSPVCNLVEDLLDAEIATCDAVRHGGSGRRRAGSSRQPTSDHPDTTSAMLDYIFVVWPFRRV